MDLTQITIAQTCARNQLRYDEVTGERAVLRQEQRRAAIGRLKHMAQAVIIRTGAIRVALSHMARHRATG